MRKYLSFVCPTDYLESIIHNAFEGEHYFFTSLGNSMTFDKGMIAQIKGLLSLHNIREISFILSDDNHIVLDALENQDFRESQDLRSYYDQIAEKKEYSEGLWQPYHRQVLISSYHLSNKIRELRLELGESFIDNIQIHAKIYKRKEGIFRDIYPDLILREHVSIN